MEKVLTIQDISCIGQCSITVALPILSSMGIETAIMPTAVLSTHTAFFQGFTCKDLTDQMEPIKEHWQKEQFKFSGLYTGYLASTEQINIVKDIIQTFKNDHNIYLCDPAMADNGKLYPAFDLNFAKNMASLCAISDYIVPNITEACFILGEAYKEEYDQKYIETLLIKLHQLGAKNVLLTGVKFNDNELGVAMYDGKKITYYLRKKINKMFHGTGDIFASCFFGGLIRGLSMKEAAKLAVEFVVSSIEETLDVVDTHWYGVRFERCLKMLTNYKYQNE